MKNDYLIFHNGELPCTKFLKNGFRHILVLKNDGYNWLLINPTKSGLEIDILPLEADVSIESILKDQFKDSSVLSVDTIPKQKSNYLFRPTLLTCVMAIKYYLGIKCWALTPYQLYRTLLYDEDISHLLNVNYIQGEEYGWSF